MGDNMKWFNTLILFSVLVLIVFFIAGCAGMQYAMKHYSGVPVVHHKMPDDTYRVFDKPNEGRLMITSSLGAAAAGGAKSGITFGAASSSAPRNFFQEAAESYLKKTGRDCTIKDGHLIVSPQWEFFYECK